MFLTSKDLDAHKNVCGQTLPTRPTVLGLEAKQNMDRKLSELTERLEFHTAVLKSSDAFIIAKDPLDILPNSMVICPKAELMSNNNDGNYNTSLLSEESMEPVTERRLELKPRKSYHAKRQYCYLCGDHFNGCIRGLQHFINNHPGRMFYMCSLCGACGKQFNTLHGAVGHVRWSHHTNATFAQLRAVKIIITTNNVKSIIPLIKCVKNSSNEMNEWGKAWMDTEFQCFYCYEVFTSRLELVKHVRHDHLEKDTTLGQDEPDHECPACDQCFEDENIFMQHYLSRHKEYLICPKHCYKQFTDFDEFNKHIKYINKSRRFRLIYENGEFACKHCGELFAKKNDLGKHNLKEHNEGFTCEYCGKSFHNSTILSIHRRLHTRPFKFKCKLCPKSYQEPYLLRTHMLIHSNVKKFTCEICGAQVKSQQSLRVHVLSHNPEYMCDVCGKGFHSLTRAQHHTLQAHSGLKSHKCMYCDRAYTTGASLRKHMGNVHGRIMKVTRGRKKTLLRFVDVPETELMATGQYEIIIKDGGDQLDTEILPDDDMVSVLAGDNLATDTVVIEETTCYK